MFFVLCLARGIPPQPTTHYPLTLPFLVRIVIFTTFFYSKKERIFHASFQMALQGRSPTISDKGSQFFCHAFKSWCKRKHARVTAQSANTAPLPLLNV
jgi:hypothetical protein